MRAALYVRVSTDRQQQAQTIEQQVTQLRTYPKEKAGYWTRPRAFTQVKQGLNIQLLPYSLVCCSPRRVDGRRGARLSR
jgi:hypothetical protein